MCSETARLGSLGLYEDIQLMEGSVTMHGAINNHTHLNQCIIIHCPCIFLTNMNYLLHTNADPSKILITPVTVGVPDSERDIHLEIPDNKLPEKLMQYRISIASIEPFEPDSNHSIQGALTNIVGEGIELKVYDNDCELIKIELIIISL